MKLLVTGGAGFIGSEFVRQSIREGQKIIVIDKLTYAGNLNSLKEVRGDLKFYKADICDRKIVGIFKKEKPEIVVHFAAETHVDRSIIDANNFIHTNVRGTQLLLDICRKFPIKKFVHISTDEVYGEIERGKFRETSPMNPNSPYSASKAAADMLVKAYQSTYSLPCILLRPCNNYGPWQFPDKLIPLVIRQALKNKKIPVYGKGQNVREWLFVSDCARAVWLAVKKGRVGEIYNIGSQEEKKNIDTVKFILKILNKPENLIEFVKDRPGHDLRYSLNCDKIKNELGWKPEVKFEQGLRRTAEHYVPILSGRV